MTWRTALALALLTGSAVGSPEPPPLRLPGSPEATSQAMAGILRARDLQTSDPAAAYAVAAKAAQLLYKVGKRPATKKGVVPPRALLWAQAQVEMAAACRTMVQHEEAVTAYSRALRVMEAAPRPGTMDVLTGRPLEMEILANKMELAWALSKQGRHAEALAQTVAMREYAPPRAEDRKHFESTLLVEEATLLKCDGQEAEAAAALEMGLLGLPHPASSPRSIAESVLLDPQLDAIDPGLGNSAQKLVPGEGPTQEQRQLARQMNDLLQLYRWLGREEDAERVAVAAARLGGWPSTLQRPTDIVNTSIAGQPWLEFEPLPNSETSPRGGQIKKRRERKGRGRSAAAKSTKSTSLEFQAKVAAAVDKLRQATPRLLAEFDALAAGGFVEPQRECLHDPKRKGGWRYFAVQGDQRLSDGNSADSNQHKFCAVKLAPVACELVSACTVAGLVVLRAGYSELEAGAWIRPHTGPSNTQLKIHHGLRVPAGDCALLTIAGESRGWLAGESLLFDDSFEHEVTSECEEGRVVLQLVIQHPDMM